jgi:hypothetical protein
MTPGVDLWVWHPDDEPIDYERIKAAKAMLGLDVKIFPHRVDSTVDSDVRVLAVGGRPRILCDFFLITNASTMDVVADALGWALDLLDDERAQTVADTLGTIFGATVREITPAELESEQAWLNYPAW